MSTTEKREQQRRNEAHRAVDEAFENGDIDKSMYETIQDDARRNPYIIVAAAKEFAEEYYQVK